MEIEIKRKIVHILGIFTILLILIFGRLNAALIILGAVIIGVLLAEYRKNKRKYKLIKIKPVDEFEDLIEEEFKTVERPNTLPFKGAIEFGIGCFLATILFSEGVAIASVSVLSVADALSTLVGYYFGKYKLPINKNKTWEGSTTFLLITFFILVLFTNPLNAFILAIITTFVEMLPHIDDNISIPLALGISMSLLL